ncbi:MAG TPA: homoserine O-acetyltransferase [Candidatus Hydrogenedentes bacterium]|nr:homoserine O-acetyltransferase [Candidatus Hydrogenedentota bacterium]
MQDCEREKSVGLVETRFVEFAPPGGIALDGGAVLETVTVAYETYGTLNVSRDNAVLVCHALSGDAHVAGYHSPEDEKPGWWDNMVGPGKGIDTDKYFVVCSNILGGCKGTTGPGSTNPATGEPYGLDFPVVTVSDMVRVQRELVRHLGLESLLAVVGGSLGGMQALTWAAEYPEVCRGAVLIATTHVAGAQQIAFDAVGRTAIQADPDFLDGDYYGTPGPRRGLAIARMMAHITYLSEVSMNQKFGRTFRNAEGPAFSLNNEFNVETYLGHKGKAFVNRFDANTYLYTTRAIDYFDASEGFPSLDASLSRVRGRVLVVSFTSDWLFSPQQSREMVFSLARAGGDVSYCNIRSDYGHDAFLLEVETLSRLISGFLDGVQYPDRDCDTCHRPCSQHRENPVEGTPGVRLFDRQHRVDYDMIVDLVEPGSRVLDIGCESGQLLCQLMRKRQVRAFGIELDEEQSVRCVESGITVIQADVQKDLSGLPDGSFDYVILSMTLQVLEHPEKALKELLRVGRKCIVSFPNFGHWSVRLKTFFRGQAPVTPHLPYQWYDTPNRHVLTIQDFRVFCRDLGIRIEREICLSGDGPVRVWPNVRADEALCLLSQGR